MSKSFDDIVDDLKRDRDELRLRLNLAKLEAREEWDELEEKWKDIEARLERAGEEAKESLEDVGAALSVVADEIKSGYQRIRDRLKD